MGPFTQAFKFSLFLVSFGGALLFINLKYISLQPKRHFAFIDLIPNGSSPALTTEDDSIGQLPSSMEMCVDRLNQHIWFIEASSIDFLCNVPLFPEAPDRRITTKKLEFSRKSDKEYPETAAERLFGFLIPPVSGLYKFTVSSRDSSELWLSSDDSVQNARIIALVGKEKDLISKPKEEGSYQQQVQISKDIKLLSGKKYFFEVLNILHSKTKYFSVKWKLPGTTNFTIVGKNVLVPYFCNDFNLNNKFYDFEIPIVASCVNSTTNPFLLEKHVTYFSLEITEGILPKCNFSNLTESLRSVRKDVRLHPYGSLEERYYKQILIYPYEIINGVAMDTKNMSLPAWNTNNILEKENALNFVQRFLHQAARSKSKQ